MDLLQHLVDVVVVGLGALLHLHDLHRFTYMSNPYNFQVGIEDAPNLLGEMFNGGLYPWDVNMMSD